jgi:competence protein ComEC
VVSCSKNNLYGHPGELAIERMEAIGAEIFYTMDDGQITVTWDGKTFVLNCFFD